MKRILLTIAIIIVGVPAYNQVIKGKITDTSNGNPVEFAYIYFDGSSVGIQSDENGNFTLDVSKNTPNPLTVSAIGYYTVSIAEYIGSAPLIIKLKPKTIELSEINVSSRSLSNRRKSNLIIFKNEFLGTGENAQNCEILNETDIRFDYESARDMVRATSSKPLIINNETLGYQLICYLDTFEYNKNTRSFMFQGAFTFKEIIPLNERQKANIDDNREKAYMGSRMQFFRALWNNDLEANGFTLKNNFNRTLKANEIMHTDASGRKYLSYKGELGICYQSDVPFSHLEVLSGRIYFDKNGYYDQFGPIWEGYIAEKKVADMLPLEYSPSDEKRVTNTESFPPNQEVINPEIATEKIYLHVDRDIYNPGDSIWFKAYVVDGLNHKPSDNSGNLYVELISPESSIILHKVIRLFDGMGDGDFILPGNIKSGIYQLRAYTNYIRNFGDQLFFWKEISILNSSDHKVFLTRTLDYDGYKFEIDFFPEGGSMLVGTESIVAFKAIDESGNGCNIYGEIFSSDGKKITSFESSHLGMGQFRLTPLALTSYYAIITNSDGNVIKRDLPKAFPKGFILSARFSEPNILGNNLIISVNTNKETFSSFHNTDLFISISSHNRILYSSAIRINSLNNVFNLDIDSLPTGIMMVTLSSQENKPICERLVYIQKDEIPILNISTENQIYRKRDSVKVKISLDSNINDEAYLSISVCDSNNLSIRNKFPTTISSWFLLESDIRGPIENPSYYFDFSNPDRLKHIDLLLLTQGWRDFQWKYPEMKYQPENGLTISGKVTRSLLDNPVPDATIDIGVFQNDKNIFSSVSTDSDGKFFCEIENLFGKANLVVTARDSKGRPSGYIKLDSLFYTPPEVNYKSLSKIWSRNDRFSSLENFNVLIDNENIEVPENFYLIFKADSLKKDIRKKYILTDTILIGEVTIIGKRKETQQELRLNAVRTIYGQPDAEVIITPTESARNVRDILMGKVSGLSFSRQLTHNDSGIRIRGITSLNSNTEPLFLLDGVVSSYATIGSLPIEWIDRVDVIKSEKTAAYGVRGAFGVISVITKTYKELPYSPVSYSTSKTVSGFDAARIFYSPKYDSPKNTAIPDLRATLFWYPDLRIITNRDYILKYFNSDISSDYKIIVEGITAKGIPVSKTINYKVN